MTERQELACCVRTTTPSRRSRVAAPCPGPHQKWREEVGRVQWTGPRMVLEGEYACPTEFDRKDDIDRDRFSARFPITERGERGRAFAKVIRLTSLQATY